MAREAIARGLKTAHLEVLSDIATEGSEIELYPKFLEKRLIEIQMRGLLVWHLLSARIGIGKMDRMVDLRKKSIEALRGLRILSFRSFCGLTSRNKRFLL